ncbi:MAG TPA: hypothetical protein VM344_09775 [Vitreimonas sp.]|nr:hypothetical protein [Vitreimonas sp.]
MLATLRAMPWGVRLFLLYALLVLAGVGIALPYVVALAIGAPISYAGLVVMILLAYTIFTITLVLQRKQAARQLALGLASLTVPSAVLALSAGAIVAAVFLAALGALLFRGLLDTRVRTWFDQP